jgi:hypothetical protein
MQQAILAQLLSKAENKMSGGNTMWVDLPLEATTP